MISLRTALALFVAAFFAIAHASAADTKLFFGNPDSIRQSRRQSSARPAPLSPSAGSCRPRRQPRRFLRPESIYVNYQSKCRRIVAIKDHGRMRSESGNHEAAIEKSAHGRDIALKEGKISMNVPAMSAAFIAIRQGRFT